MEFPESALIRQEHIVRDLQFPSEVKHTRRSLVRWVALSLGLISPKESRQLLLDIMEALFWFHFCKEEPDIHALLAKIGEIRGEAGVNPFLPGILEIVPPVLIIKIFFFTGYYTHFLLIYLVLKDYPCEN